MKHILKIDLEFWDLIYSGKKQYEVRKDNKDYINVGDTIYFISLDEITLYGKMVVDFKKSTPYAINCSRDFKEWVKTIYKLDYETRKFIDNNYDKENYLLLLRLVKEESQ